MKIKNKIIRDIVAIIITIVVLMTPIIFYKYMDWDADFIYCLLMHTILIFDTMFVYQRVKEWLNQKVRLEDEINN